MPAQEWFPTESRVAVETQRRVMLDQLLRETGAEAEIHVASKHPVEFVEQAVQETQSGLLIVGRSVRHDVFGGPHGDAYAIVRRSPVPVLSV